MERAVSRVNLEPCTPVCPLETCQEQSQQVWRAERGAVSPLGDGGAGSHRVGWHMHWLPRSAPRHVLRALAAALDHSGTDRDAQAVIWNLPSEGLQARLFLLEDVLMCSENGHQCHSLSLKQKGRPCSEGVQGRLGIHHIDRPR